nr:unnamed protein product [Callosobruchus analis]
MQIGYREIPGLDLNLPPADLRRHQELQPPVSYSDYRTLPESNPSDKEDYFAESPQKSSEEHSCEESGNQHPFPKPIYITYVQLYYPKKIHHRNIQEPSRKQLETNVPASLVLPLSEFPFNNFPQFPGTYTSAGSASLPIRSSHKTQEAPENLFGGPSASLTGEPDEILEFGEPIPIPPESLQPDNTVFPIEQPSIKFSDYSDIENAQPEASNMHLSDPPIGVKRLLSRRDNRVPSISPDTDSFVRERSRSEAQSKRKATLLMDPPEALGLPHEDRELDEGSSVSCIYYRYLLSHLYTE